MKLALIVDDKPDNVYFLRALLSGHGFQVDEAQNGAEALNKARQQTPTLVISDLLMPIMDGYTLLRHWKADAQLKLVPFIVYTATYTSPKDEQLALDMGADAFIVKPAEPEPFMERVLGVLEGSEHAPAPVRMPTGEESSILKMYSQVLVNKLEKRTRELEQRVVELTAAEERIRRLGNFYAALSETNKAIVHLSDREQLFHKVCRIAVERSGFALAWIGECNAGDAAPSPLATFGQADEWLEMVRNHGIPGVTRTPMEIALADGQPFICNNAQAEPRLAMLMESLERMGLHSAAAFPLRAGERIVAGLELLAYDCDVFDQTLSDLLAEMATDVSFALENFEREALRQQAEARLRASEAANRLSNRAVEASANGILISDCCQPGHPIIRVNPAFERITGYAEKDVVGRDARFLLGDEPDQLGVEEIRSALRERREGQAILRNFRKDGSLFWNELSIAPVRAPDGNTTHFVGVINDISERKAYEEQLERQANRDDLTGLANRNLLKDRIGQAIAYAASAHGRMAVLFLDLDHFKRINDSLSHGAGDTVLRIVAGRMVECADERWTLARLGGDEFVVVLPDVARAQDAALAAARILHAIAEAMPMDGHELKISASIGIGLYPDDGADVDSLLRNADAAMYGAKERGRNGYRFYTSDMNAHALAQLELEERLRHAVVRDELFLHYQPLLSLQDNTINDVEALLRWRSPAGRTVYPADFIPLAEDTGLIIPIGEWVLSTACRQAMDWQRAGGPQLRVAVNLSARQFSDADLVHIVRRALAETRLPAHLLKLEVTESAVMDDAKRAAVTLGELKALGVGISVDDFGTGYSSLAYLRRFPIDQLKIDRSFVHDMNEHPESAAIVHGIIGLARSLHLQTVGEGVETAEQRDFLHTAGCDMMQGFLFSHPLPPDELFSLLLSHARTAPA